MKTKNDYQKEEGLFNILRNIDTGIAQGAIFNYFVDLILSYKDKCKDDQYHKAFLGSLICAVEEMSVFAFSSEESRDIDDLEKNKKKYARTFDDKIDNFEKNVMKKFESMHDIIDE